VPEWQKYIRRVRDMSGVHMYTFRICCGKMICINELVCIIYLLFIGLRIARNN